ncbi:hypothetical protein AMATHDRAFT_57914 [Amanita thiersii Skay4041]|uniref:Uncharacterized protein n=1 Tax=Amanita thiersii Skay4041 TaxID=703135 RepID=A0A2A9NM61_9AGAR|nr:hypothetical protein AMATHDRAFT_57914 [Amanita thiersii Skay4041]
MIERFADKLAETFIKGELSIGDWSVEKGAKINLAFVPASATSRGVKIPLAEIEATEAAGFATKLLLEVALQAQSQGCRLYKGSSVPARLPTLAPPIPGRSRKVMKRGADELVEDEERRVLGNGKGEVGKEKGRGQVKSGGSLANPNKKARKYAEIQFESD